MHRIVHKHFAWLRLHWLRLLLFVVFGLFVLLGLVQIFYPNDRMLPFANVEDQDVSMWKKADVAKLLDDKYATQKLDIYLGEAEKPVLSPMFADFGVKVANGSRVDGLSYSWWLKLVPTSLFWAQAVVGDGQADIARDGSKSEAYVMSSIGNACKHDPTNATIKANGATLEVVPSEKGGVCEAADVVKVIDSSIPIITGANSVKVAIEEIAPTIDDAQAKALADSLQAKAEAGVVVQAGSQPVTIPATDILSWIDFAVVESKLVAQMNGDRAADYLAKNITPKVAVAAGTTKITTYDFVETARVNGATGQTLNRAATLDSILGYLNGTTDQVVATTSPLPPNVTYSRGYSATDQGLSALLANYAKDHPGTFGVSLIELSGQRRRASYNDTRVFRTASTYKLFVAYSTLKRVEDGRFNWSDQISGGRDLAQCFDDMIVKSDNACAEALLNKVGHRALTDEARALGLPNTTFSTGDSPSTTSADLATFLATLESGQMLSATSRDRLLGAMKRNIYRQGIPAGASGQVADKVGFLWGLLHDAAIVYSPSGTYVLTIMTDGSSWQAIADLTRQIETLRAS